MYIAATKHFLQPADYQKSMFLEPHGLRCRRSICAKPGARVKIKSDRSIYLNISHKSPKSHNLAIFDPRSK